MSSAWFVGGWESPLWARPAVAVSEVAAISCSMIAWVVASTSEAAIASMRAVASLGGAGASCTSAAVRGCCGVAPSASGAGTGEEAAFGREWAAAASSRALPSSVTPGRRRGWRAVVRATSGGRSVGSAQRMSMAMAAAVSSPVSVPGPSHGARDRCGGCHGSGAGARLGVGVGVTIGGRAGRGVGGGGGGVGAAGGWRAASWLVGSEVLCSGGLAVVLSG